MSLIPNIDKKDYSKSTGKRGRRSDKKFRVRLYMSAHEREKLEEAALKKGSYFTKYASELVEKVCQYTHRQALEVEKIKVRETYAFIKLSQLDYEKIRQYASLHKCTLEMAAYTFFEYSKISRTKVKNDEKKALIKKKDDSFKQRNVKIVNYSDNNDSVVIY